MILFLLLSNAQAAPAYSNIVNAHVGYENSSASYSILNSSYQDVGSLFGGGPSHGLARAHQVNTENMNALNQGVNRLEEMTCNHAHTNDELVRTLTTDCPYPARLVSLVDRITEAKAHRPVTACVIPAREEEIPYRFESPPSAFKDELVHQYGMLYKIKPTGFKRVTARDLGLVATELADHSYSQKDEEDARFYKEMGKSFLDIAFGLDPVTGFGRSAFELYTGRNLITGVDLNSLERSLAFVGVASLGTSNLATKALRITHVFEKAIHMLKARQAFELSVKEGGKLYQSVEHVVSGLSHKTKITHIHASEAANAKWFPKYVEKPPFQLGTHVVEMKLLTDSHFVRFHTLGANPSGWVMRASAIEEGFTIAQIRDKFSIGNHLTHISDIHVPAGSTLLRGYVEHHSGGKSGAIQYFLTEIKENWFFNTRPF